MRADMILLEGNQLEDIGATRRIRKVWLRGVEVDAL
jgi:imidazolonepropionase-like amidohydrolase